MHKLPLVTVICLCYNHEKYVKAALESVLFQTYSAVELLIVDDASQDKSVQKIQEFMQELPQYLEAFTDKTLRAKRQEFSMEFIQNTLNRGNCTAFNQALKLAKGKYIIDLAADDMLLDDRITEQVEIFETLDESYAVVFSNTLDIDPNGSALRYHYPVNDQGKTKVNVPSGDVYVNILKAYFISTPSMMMKKSVLDELGGYDEKLSYEDFDFWVRASRKYKFYYQDEVTTQKRVLKESHSSGFLHKKNNPHLESTLKVCHKAYQLNQNQAEHQALAICVNYHLRQAFFTQNYDLVQGYYALLQQIPVSVSKTTKIIVFLARLRVPIFGLYSVYLFILKKMPYVKVGLHNTKKSDRDKA